MRFSATAMVAALTLAGALVDRACAASSMIELRTDTPTRVHHSPRDFFSLSAAAANKDGLYLGGTHLLLLRPDLTVAWALAPNCRIEDLRALPDGGAVLLARWCNLFGLEQNERTPNADAPVLARVTAAGQLTWARQLRGNTALIISGPAIGIDGSIYIAGYSATPHRRMFSNTTRNARHDILVIKLDSAGSLLWSRRLKTEEGDRGIGLALGKDNNPIVLGYDGHIAKIDQEGGLLWSGQLETQARPLTAVAIVPDGHGGAIVAGNEAALDRSGLNAFAVAIDAAGRVRHAEFVDAGPSDRIEQAESDGEDGIVMIGSTRRAGPTLEDKVHRLDGWLVQVDAGGAVLASVTLGGEMDDYVSDAAMTGEGFATVGRMQPTRGEDGPAVAYRPFSLAAGNCPYAEPLSAATSPMPARLVEWETEVSDVDLSVAAVDISLLPASVVVAGRCRQAY